MSRVPTLCRSGTGSGNRGQADQRLGVPAELEKLGRHVQLAGARPVGGVQPDLTTRARLAVARTGGEEADGHHA